MKQEVKVVIGANYGDEGKGMVSSLLAKEAVDHKKKVLTVLFNGGIQRGHTANGVVHHCVGAGAEFGSDTYYSPRFMLDPIAIWLSESRVYVDPECRVVLPCDVITGRNSEVMRGDARHGSCGLGIFAACKRNAKPSMRLLAKELFFNSLELLEKKYIVINHYYDLFDDEVYNKKNFFEAVKWVRSKCICKSLDNIKSMYQTVIFEGGQGLLLDQGNLGDFPHLTPSSTGVRNTLGMIRKLGGLPDVYYVSRTYMTRHGSGPFPSECSKDDINPDIVDETNVFNEWQGKLRFGYLFQAEMDKRIRRDIQMLNGFDRKRINLVFTHANYTGGKIVSFGGIKNDIVLPNYANRLWISDEKDSWRLEER